jgi:hypothetical protein
MGVVEDLGKNNPQLVYLEHIYKLIMKGRISKELKAELEKAGITADSNNPGTALTVVDNSLGIFYELAPTMDTKTLDSIVEDSTEKEVLQKQEAAKRALSKNQTFSEVTKKALEEVCKELNPDMGIMEKDGELCVYLKVESYILEGKSTQVDSGEWAKGYYLFPETKVYFKLKMSGDRLVAVGGESGSPLVEGVYWHPFTYTKDRDPRSRMDSDICFGGPVYDRVSEVKDTAFGKILFALAKGKGMLQTGLIQGVHPRTQMQTCVGSGQIRRISESDVARYERNRIHVTNRSS